MGKELASKELASKEFLRALLDTAVKAEPECDGLVKGIEITHSEDEKSNWDGAMLRMPNDKIPDDCTRAFLAAKVAAFRAYDLLTDD